MSRLGGATELCYGRRYMTDPQKSPLDMLDELLKDAKGGAPAGDAADPAVAEATAAAATAQAEAGDQALVDELGALHKEKDEAALQAEVDRLASIKNSPEYQARTEQATAQEATDQQSAADNQGFDIKQVGHTKI